MSIIDRIRQLFGGRQSAAESTAVMGGATAATSHDDRTADADPAPSDSGWDGDGASGGDGGGGGGT
jgi:hypothetical protein